MNDTENFPPDFSWAVIKKDWEKVPYTIEQEQKLITISTKKLIILLETEPFRLTVKNNEGIIIWDDAAPSGIGWKSQELIYLKKMPEDEHYYGFGEKTGSLDKRGYYYRMYTRDPPGYQEKADPLYQAHPYFIGLKDSIAYGVFFDNTWETFFDMGKKFKDVYIIGAKNGELNLYFFYGPSIKEVIEQYTDLIGRIPLPPLWSLGYHQSRWGYANSKKVNQISKKMRDNHIPCDAIVLDIDYMVGYRVFTWDEKKFPNTKELLSNLRQDGFHIYPIIDPGVKVDAQYFMYQEGIENDYFLKNNDGTYWHGYVWPGKTYFPDFTKDTVRKWWGDKVKILVDLGVSGIWNDMNEPSYNIQFYMHRVSTKNLIFYDNGLHTPFEKNHNVYGLLMGWATYEGLLRAQPNKRPWILTRSGYPGIHRYAAVWTGDNTSSWKHMALSIPMLLNMGLSSIPNGGADICGFSFWISAPRKLLMRLAKKFVARWLQLGAFYPFARNHSVKMSKPQEPWEFGEETLEIIKKYLKLRYHWMPYFYNLFVECSKNGLPPMRPLLLEFQSDPTCYQIEDQFLWGESILFAPVVQKNLKIQEIYLPEGVWFNYWTGERYEGKRFIELPIDWHNFPIFIKAGAIIPCQPDMEFFNETTCNPLILELYPDPRLEAMYEFQEDDGETLNYQKGDFCTTTYLLSYTKNFIEFLIEDRQGSYAIPLRNIQFVFKFVKKPIKVLLNDTGIQESNNLELNKWVYNGKMPDLNILIKDTGKKQVLRIYYQ